MRRRGATAGAVERVRSEQRAYLLRLPEVPPFVRGEDRERCSHVVADEPGGGTLYFDPFQIDIVGVGEDRQELPLNVVKRRNDVVRNRRFRKEPSRRLEPLADRRLEHANEQAADDPVVELVAAARFRPACERGTEERNVAPVGDGEVIDALGHRPARRVGTYAQLLAGDAGDELVGAAGSVDQLSGDVAVAAAETREADVAVITHAQLSCEETSSDIVRGVQHLPIDEHLAAIERRVREDRHLIITAAPGAGKSTRVPPRLTALGRVILLQPRRVAARSLAARIASEQRWTLGGEVGWQVRFDRRFSRETALLVATEGILSARLQSDPLLSDFNVVILDEFHERSIHSDLAIALARQAADARDDLHLVVMSATLDAAMVSRFLDGAPVINVAGREFPVDITYAPDGSMQQAVSSSLARTSGHILCFLPGTAEIRRTIDELRPVASSCDVIPLHGNLTSDEQDRALAPSQRRKVIVATNIAETSLTIDGVTAVVDSGLHKVMRYDAARALDRLFLERIPRDAADQRAGRAGRTAPGVCVRLWDQRTSLEPHREAEIHRVDLAPSLLAIVAWGGDPRNFEWFEKPDAYRIDAAFELLSDLRLIRDGRLTDHGVLANRLPLHPRLATFLVAAGGGERAALAATMLSELRASTRKSSHAAESDIFPLIDEAAAYPGVARQAAALGKLVGDGRRDADDESLLRALFEAFPDRVARRRERNSEQFLLASGRGATLARESSVRTSEWVVALEVIAVNRPEPLITMASAVRPEWITPTRVETSHRIERGRPRSFRQEWYRSILIREWQVELDADAASRLRLEEIRRKSGADPLLQEIVRRARVAGVQLDLDALFELAAASPGDVRWLDLLDYRTRAEIDRGAPLTLPVPSGRSVRLEYTDDGEVRAAVKLQELFGLLETPRVGRHEVPVTFLLLAPNGNPVQTTKDLRSFWTTTYAEVRKDLRGRYPKHPWPDDPLTAAPTAKTKRQLK